MKAARKLATTMVGVLILGLLTMGCPEPGPTTYTVTLDANGGTAGTITTITVAHGETVPTNTTGLPTRTGYTLAGWYKEAALTNEFVFATETIIANTTIYAKWNLIFSQAKASAEFSARRSHTTVVFNNKIWVIGGFDSSYKNDVWRTELSQP